MKDLETQPDPAAPAATASAKERMAHRMKTTVGKNHYKLRKQTVEPVFGIIKEVLGFRRFRLRSKAKVELEWQNAIPRLQDTRNPLAIATPSKKACIDSPTSAL